MANSSFLFENTESILPSPRRVRWIRDFNGHDIGYGGPSNAHHLFSFRPGFTGNVAAGDRITIERTAGNANYGIAVGTVSVWRGVVGVSFVTPGSPSILNISLILDGDAHTLPNATFGSANDSNSTWRVISMENPVCEFADQWYLADLTDRQEVNADVLRGILHNRETMAGLGLLRATNGTTTASNIKLGILNTADGGLSMIPIANQQNFFNVGTPTLSPAGTIAVEGAGSQNAIIRVSNNNSFLNITNSAAFSHFPNQTNRLYGYRFVPQTGKTVSDTTAAAIFLGDEVETEVLFGSGWKPPLFRNYREHASVSESGLLLQRYTTPLPDKMAIPIRYFNETEAVTTIRRLAHRCQRENFLFSYRKGETPIAYLWCEDTGQPKFSAPSIMEVNFKCKGYIMYSLGDS